MKQHNAKITFIFLFPVLTLLSVATVACTTNKKEVALIGEITGLSQELVETKLNTVKDIITRAEQNGYSREHIAALLMKQLDCQTLEKEQSELNWREVTLYSACMAAALGFIAISTWTFYMYKKETRMLASENAFNQSLLLDTRRRRSDAGQDFPRAYWQ